MIRLRPTLFHVPRLPRRWTTQSNACSAHDHAPDPFAANTSGYAAGLAQDIPLVLAYHFRRRALKGWGETENRRRVRRLHRLHGTAGIAVLSRPAYPVVE